LLVLRIRLDQRYEPQAKLAKTKANELTIELRNRTSPSGDENANNKGSTHPVRLSTACRSVPRITNTLCHKRHFPNRSMDKDLRSASFEAWSAATLAT